MVILISGILPKASGHHFGIRNSDCQDVINFAASFVLHLVLDGFVSDACDGYRCDAARMRGAIVYVPALAPFQLWRHPMVN